MQVDELTLHVAEGIRTCEQPAIGKVFIKRKAFRTGFKMLALAKCGMIGPRHGTVSGFPLAPCT